MRSLFYCILFLSFSFSIANKERDNILLVGSETVNEYKRPILQYLHPNFNEIDRVFSQDAFAPNIVIVGNQLRHLSSFKENRFVQFHTIDSNASTTVFTLKGLDELNLEEIRVLHQLIYQTNGGLIAIELGPSVIQTRSFLDYSAFCWSTGHLVSELANDEVSNRVFLCNGIRPSIVADILNAQTVEPLNKKIEPTVLPTAPEPHFWPVFVASAAEAESKKQRSSKHTAQPNARQNKIYGKDKKKSDSASAEERTESPRDAKLGCRYRYSCYEEAGIKADKPTVHKPTKNEGKSNEKSATVDKQQSKSDDLKDDKREPKTDDKRDFKVQCKYRESCYKTGKLNLDAIREAKHHVPKSAEKEVVLDKSKPASELDSKLKCKYRHSCYEEVGIKERSSREQKPSSQERHKKKSKEEEEPELPIVEKQAKEKQSKSKDETKESPKKKEKQSKNEETPERRVSLQNKNADQIEVDIDDNPDFKVQCKYRKSCYETGKLDLDAIHETKTTYIPKSAEKEVVLDRSKPASELDAKLSCKYRHSCYKTGKLDLDAIHETKTTYIPKSAEKEDYSDRSEPISEVDAKLKCKYRKSCYDDNKFESVRERPKKKGKVHEEPEIVPAPVVVEEVVETSDDESQEDVQRDESQEVIEEVIEESEETPISKEKPSKKSARKSKESSSEFKAKDPNRYVHRFKTVGKYEKVPKSSIVEEDEEGSIDEETPIDINDQNENEEVSAEISEPLEPVVEEPEDQEIEETGEAIEEAIDEPEDQESDVEKVVIPKTTIEFREETTHTEDDDTVPAASLQEKVKCKYRKSCLRTGVLPDLEEERKNAKIREASTTVRETPSQQPVTKDGELDRLHCKYRHSCYSQQNVQQEAKQESSKRATQTKLAEDRKPKSTESDEKDDDDETEAEVKANKTVVDLNSINTNQRLQCKYRTSCYSGIQPPTKRKTPTLIVPIPSESPRHVNSKCHKYYLSCREEMGLPPRDNAPKVNGRRLCRKKKPNEQTH